MLAPSYRISFQCTFIMYLKNQDPMVIGWNRVTLGGVELPWVYPPTHHRSFFAPILCGHGQATQRPDRIFQKFQKSIFHLKFSIYHIFFVIFSFLKNNISNLTHGNVKPVNMWERLAKEFSDRFVSKTSPAKQQ